ncbi:winged helix DNA-binding protein (plasmid) [Bradyrhizobium septentrionale]|uniref:Winged helix DNA-binding protein n=1 Tax=Bradyrhizobium septentrionale TaxID=1404411 RepID=A0A973WA08_9BRAD|nr:MULTISPECIES: winged helix DNA-binding protein [Bradyrhizobium]MCK7664878.1 winged helix DNA-binding protein [Bradyrhizobium sp. 2S1]UGY20961.1 winged helix DNA-binding protein [Bradyrhizobium septentrionale]
MDRLLDGVSSAQADPDEVFPRLRSCYALLSDKEKNVEVAHEAVYAALRSAVWAFISSGDSGPHLNRWMDLVLRVRQFMRVHRSGISERLTTLSDMLEQSANAADQAGRLKLGKNHLLVLDLLQQRRGEAARADLAKETGLKDSNLSHVLSKLAAFGLIDRIPVGREATIRITDKGRKAISGRQELERQGREDPPAFCDWIPYPMALADMRGSTVRCNEAFARLLQASQDGLEKMPVEILRQSLAARIQDEEFGELTDSDGCARRVIEASEGDRTFWLAVDVDMYRRRIDELEKRESVLAHELTEARSLVAPHAGVSRARDDFARFYADAPQYDFAGMVKQLTPDVMTSVSSIAAASRLLFESKSLKGDERSYCAAIVNNSDHLKNVLGGMIAVADADPFALVVVPFRPHSIASEIVKNFAYSSKAHGYTIATVHSDADHEMMADPYAFKAALQTTIAGVVKVLPRGANVGIKTVTREHGIEVDIVADVVGTSGHILPLNALAQCQAYVSSFGGTFDQVEYRKGSICTKYLWPSERRRIR